MQPIRYLTTDDGVQLAWTAAGSGPTVVRTASWLTHLQYDRESPVWRHWIRFFEQHFRFVRSDERGCGMTLWRVPDVSLSRWSADLGAVIDAATDGAPVTLLGLSQGAATAVAFAARHPERVARLILYGGFAMGSARRGDADAQRLFDAIVELVRHGWGRDDPTFRQVFTRRFVPDASPEQLEWLNELCRRTTSGDVAAHLLQARADVDVRELLAHVRAPTLVVHATRDEAVPIEYARLLAAGIPGAEFVQVESRNHILLEHEPAWARFRDVVLEFTGRRRTGEEDRFGNLAPRERDVLAALASGHSNAEIGTRLAISEKTVRNMLTRIFDKLGVKSRAQAIVLARDAGFR